VRSHQRASIYGRDEGFYVTSEDRTVDGFSVIGTPRRVPTDADDQALGAAVLSALDASRDGVPTPARDAPVASALVSLSPCKTWRSFAKRATLVCTTREGGEIFLEQWGHMEVRGDAFEPLADIPTQRVSASNPAAIGALLRKLAEPP
jgi:hypothetical protein